MSKFMAQPLRKIIHQLQVLARAGKEEVGSMDDEFLTA